MKKVFVALSLLLCVQSSNLFAEKVSTTSIQGKWVKVNPQTPATCVSDAYCHCVTVTITPDNQDIANPPNGLSGEVDYSGTISADPNDPNGFIIGYGDFSLWNNGNGSPVITITAYDGPNNTAGTQYIVNQVSISADYPKTITFLQ